MKSMQEAETKGENEILEDTDSKVYELGYLLVPTITEENISVNYGDLKELVSSFGGEIISDEMPKMIPLSYSMQKVIYNIRNKFNTAYFGWIKFVMNSQKVLQMKSKLSLDPSIIRFLIVKTVKENTMSVKRFAREDSYRRTPTTKKRTVTETAVPINKAEIDKKLDELLVE